MPYKDGSFDAVISGMTFGTLPNQKLALNEMIRVVKSGGLVCIGAHGPEHYWEAIDASFRSITKRYILGYRLEWWPRTEGFIRGLLERFVVLNIQISRLFGEMSLKMGQLLMISFQPYHHPGGAPQNFRQKRGKKNLIDQESISSERM